MAPGTFNNLFIYLKLARVLLGPSPMSSSSSSSSLHVHSFFVAEKLITWPHGCGALCFPMYGHLFLSTKKLRKLVKPACVSGWPVNSNTQVGLLHQKLADKYPDELQLSEQSHVKVGPLSIPSSQFPDITPISFSLIICINTNTREA
jgi:hypothetical protein